MDQYELDEMGLHEAAMFPLRDPDAEYDEWRDEEEERRCKEAGLL